MKSYILIDRSGSMSSNWTETIGAVNAYVEALGTDKATKKAEVTVAVFDSQEPFKIIREDVKVSDWKIISDKEVLPRGMTPLYDAIGSLVTKIKNSNPKKAAVVVVTDGAENSSREYNKINSKKLLDDLRENGYDVTFIGADFDAFGQSAGLGNAMGQTLNMTKGNYEATFRGLATKSMSYASTGTVMSFSDQERSVAVGK